MSGRLTAAFIAAMRVAAERATRDHGIDLSKALARIAEREGFSSWAALIAQANAAPPLIPFYVYHVKVTFADGSRTEVQRGVSAEDACELVWSRLSARDQLRVRGELRAVRVIDGGAK